ncbi:hypothetical protein [Paenibacillus sp. FSL R7-0333]|uniref:hypothetical protein n=1 Tax=Paenibacillus sp. FSL R7-0333 TaxID=1926587 RepID=UPI0030F80631
MSAKWVTSRNVAHTVETDTIQDGLGFEPFAYESHSKRDYASFVQGYLFPLSEEIDVYAAEQESAISCKRRRNRNNGPGIFNIPLEDSENKCMITS